MIRTYPLKHSINLGKQKKVIAVVKEYRKLAVMLSALQWQELYRHGDFDKNLDIKEVATSLSSRYKQTCQYQVVGVLKSFIANRQNEFVRMVSRSSLNEETKHQLFFINKYRLWFAKQAKMCKGDELKGEKAKRIKAKEKAQEDVARLSKQLNVLKDGAQEETSSADKALLAAMFIKTQDTLERAKLRQSSLEKQVEEENNGEGEYLSIPKETLKLARAIEKHILSKHRKPTLRHCKKALDNKVAKVTPREETEQKKAKKFAYWLTLTIMKPRQPIYLPLSTNNYFEEKSGTLKKFCQINIGEQDRVTVCLIKDVEKKVYVAKTPKISLDFGLRNLFATDRGDLFGRNFIAMLKKYDCYITSLSRNRQRQGFVIKSHTYNSLVRHLRNFLKNEINRVINRIIEVYQPQEIVVENLNFTSPDLSSCINRLLSNMGRKIIREVFNSISEEEGIVITQVKAPYTSKLCYVCGYVDALNRHSQSSFICRHCHKKLHADVNGARNIFSRSSSKELSNVYLSTAVILDILLRQFLCRQRDISTCAPLLVESNPYFKKCRQYGTSGKRTYG